MELHTWYDQSLISHEAHLPILVWLVRRICTLNPACLRVPGFILPEGRYLLAGVLVFVEQSILMRYGYLVASESFSTDSGKAHEFYLVTIGPKCT